jgi:phosphatidylglycerophosphatase A
VKNISLEYEWSTCLRLGYMTAPGTWGSLVGVLLYGVFQFLPFFLHMTLWAMVVAYSIYAASIVAHRLNLHDPQQVISDEVVGMWLVLIMVQPGQIVSGLFAFILFRVFDILKPGPVKWAEKLDGGLGIMADDLVAAVLSALVIFVLRLV